MVEVELVHDGASVYVVDHGGSGPAIVMIHGANRTHADWDPVAAALDGLRLVAFDLPGHGRSAAPATWTIDGAGRCVRTIVEALGLRRPILAGHSLGGMVAASLAASSPDDFAAALNIDGHGLPDPGLYDGMDPAEVARIQQRSLTSTANQLASRPEGEGAPLLVLAQIVQSVGELDLFDLYRRVRVPLEIVSCAATAPGADDDAARMQAAYRRGLGRALRAVADQNPHVTVVEAEATHAILTEAPAIAADLIRRLARLA